MKINITVNAPDVVKAAQTVADSLDCLLRRASPETTQRGSTPTKWGEAPEAPAPTLEQLSMAATLLVDANRGGELRALLRDKYGVDAMTKLRRSDYGAFAADLRAMGAKI